MTDLPLDNMVVHPSQAQPCDSARKGRTLATLERVQSTNGSPGASIVEEVRRMDPVQIAEHIDRARKSSSMEIVERQRLTRRERAERAAARFRPA